MNPKEHFCGPVLNKIFAAVPLVLLIGCDGDRGDESLIALCGTLVLALCLTWLEHRSATSNGIRGTMAISLCCSVITIIVAGAELVCFTSMNKLHGPISAYGIFQTLAVMTALFLPTALLSAWADWRRK
jgi:hypothetical protein